MWSPCGECSSAWAEEPTQPGMGLGEWGEVWTEVVMASLGLVRRVSWAGPHRDPSYLSLCP